MTPEKMLKLTSKNALPARLAHSGGPSPAPSAGVRIKRSAVEPWMIDLLDQHICPVCGDDPMLYLHSTFAPKTHFYTCKENPTEHRFTIIED
jgi:hypothetical protein